MSSLSNYTGVGGRGKEKRKTHIQKQPTVKGSEQSATISPGASRRETESIIIEGQVQRRRKIFGGAMHTSQDEKEILVLLLSCEPLCTAGFSSQSDPAKPALVS